MTDDENLTKEICNLNTTHHQPLPSPSPRPSPQGRGRHLIPLSKQRRVADGPRTGKRFSLSPRERAGVRGKQTYFSATCPRLVAKTCQAILRDLPSQNLKRISLGKHFPWMAEYSRLDSWLEGSAYMQGCKTFLFHPAASHL